jgi:hypothetical protein
VFAFRMLTVKISKNLFDANSPSRFSTDSSTTPIDSPSQESLKETKKVSKQKTFGNIQTRASETLDP